MSSAVFRVVQNPNHRSLVELRTLVRSLRSFGGNLSESVVEIHYVDNLPEEGDGMEDDLNVIRKVVPSFDKRSPHTNKLGMFYEIEADYLVAVDADIVVADDLSPYLTGEAVKAVPAYGDFITKKQWEYLFASCDTPFPTARVLTIHRQEETVPYFNSGVLIVPRSKITPLSKAWIKATRIILPLIEDWTDGQRFFAEQFGLTIALCQPELSWRELPYPLNWVLNCKLPEILSPDLLKPVLMHSFHNMNYDSEEILATEHFCTNQAVERYNNLLKSSSK